jgi:Predicted N-acetylglucosamine kinase
MKTLLVCDSGSTKADWCMINKNEKRTYFTTCGMNPYNISHEAICEEIESVLCSAIDPKEVEDFVFYGTGCGSQAKCDELKDLFSTYFTCASVNIEHDLMGAARALCGNKAGLCAILGTGSNSCLYDGKNITHNVPSLGYVLCDEGAGTNIGKLILRNYLRHLLPEDLDKEFKALHPGAESDFLNRLYKGTRPNNYLASFAKFVTDRQDNEYCRDLIAQAFSSFFEYQIKSYPNYEKYKVNVVGSVGYYCKYVFKQVAEQYGLEPGKFIKAPLESLIQYHFSFE